MVKFQVICVVIFLIGCLGWVSNIYQLFKCDFESPYKAEAIRAVGIVVAPMGAVTGFFHIDDSTPDPNSI